MAVARDFSVYSSVNLVSLVLLLGTALVLRRYLGLVQAGIWSTLELLPNYAQYAPLGILNSAERDLPYLLGVQQVGEFERRKHTLFWLTHAIGAALMIALVTGALVLRSRITSPLFVGLLAYAPLLWLQILSAYYVVLYRARKRFVVLSTRQGISNLLKAALLMAGGYIFGLYGVFAALLIATAVQALVFHTGLDERFERVFDRRVLRPMLLAGLPMLVGAVSFETVRNADRIVITSVLGLEIAGVYSLVPIICQGLFYLPNTLALVMFPRYQERYGETQTAVSLRRFVEIPLHVLGDALLAAILVLLVALPPLVAAYFPPDYSGSLAPLAMMLVATYFLCLSPPAGQFLLTIHKQVEVLCIAVPAMALALAAAYAGSSYALLGVAAGVAGSAFAYFVVINLYAFSHLGTRWEAIRPILDVSATAAIMFAFAWVVNASVPTGTGPLAAIGGWRLLLAAAVALPLLARAARRVRALSGPPQEALNGPS